MKLYDISQGVFSGKVFPGDPVPQKDSILSIERGDMCNLTALSMCAHNGTHIDAPRHFINNGRAVDELPLEVFVGKAYVARRRGDIDADVAREILASAEEADAECAQRILLAGELTVTADAARVFADAQVLLVGNEAQTVGPADAPREVHLTLLGAGAALLEGIRLDAVAEGVYFLSCAPLCLENADGAPCRAILIEE